MRNSYQNAYWENKRREQRQRMLERLLKLRHCAKETSNRKRSSKKKARTKCRRAISRDYDNCPSPPDGVVDGIDKRGCGNATLIDFCRSGDRTNVKKLLRGGADPDTPCHDGCSPTWYAAAYGYPEIIQLLHNNGANISAPNSNGISPLSIAHFEFDAGVPGTQQCIEYLDSIVVVPPGESP